MIIWRLMSKQVCNKQYDNTKHILLFLRRSMKALQAHDAVSKLPTNCTVHYTSHNNHGLGGRPLWSGLSDWTPKKGLCVGCGWDDY